jgi:hypothetical protein
MVSTVAGALKRGALLAILAAPLAAGPLGAQVKEPRDFRSGLRTGFGYSAVLPDAIYGLGAFHFAGQRPVGVFVDMHLTALSGIRHDKEYCPAGIVECTNAWVLDNRNDMNVGETKEWLAFNAGLAYALTPEFAVLFGAGMARETIFQEFFDETADGAVRLTDSGSYYVENDAAPSWKPQAVIAILMRGGRNLAFRLGYETALGGLDLGAYIRLH